MLGKPMKRYGKRVLLAGCSVLALGAIAIHDDIVRAIEWSADSLSTDLSEVAPAWTVRSRLLGASAAVSSEQTSLNPEPTDNPERTYLAVNAEPITPDQPNPTVAINPITPEQVAVNDWRGASFPVENFQTYTSPFGYRRSPDGSYNQEFHYGLDMAAPEGSYIRNWWAGIVVEVSDDSNCGTSVVVESGPWQHIYCHMQGHVERNDQGRYMIDRGGGIQIFEGQSVIAGQRIGRVGMTGRTTGPHLHWGLKYDSNWVDPALVLQAMYYSQQAAEAQP